MLKRKYGDRSNWKRIIQREYAQKYVETEEFTGYITLLHMIEAREPLSIRYGEKDLTIIDNGYMWLQQFPFGKHHAITTTFDEKGDIVQWYIDISLENSLEGNRPYLDDLYLDIVVFPSGKVILLDEDELEAALKNRLIDQSMYDLAWEETKAILPLLHTHQLELIKLANVHKEMLIHSLS
ncbi:DUF402 domain-containing protein [Bacillus spongiae]|uniref:DUF402 domain-containing protein n=1 Tax=Bacillus spongiae TaxID=2683610 RepID=A0ABU8HCV9_9BACI